MKLYDEDKILYTRSLASYYGFFKPVYKLEGVEFKMKLIDKYMSYKNKYKNNIILIRNGIFYKTFDDDAKIIWHLFKYKLINNSVSFGTSPYDKVISKLEKLDIGFVVIDNDKEVLYVKGDSEVYSSYKLISNKAYDKSLKREKLINKFMEVIIKCEDAYDDLDKFLDKYID